MKRPLIFKLRKNSDFSNKAVIEIIFFLVFFAYFKSLFLPFLHDDFAFIVRNPQVTNFDLISVFLKPAISIQGQPLVNAYYRPILEITYRIQYKLFHLNPFGYHFFNILLHAFNSFLVFKVVGGFCKKAEYPFSIIYNQIAFVIALIFSLHPVQSEAVNCISGISNLMVSSFILLSLWFFLQCKYKAERRGLFYFLSLFFFLMGLLTKEQAIILPLLVGFYEYFNQKKRVDNVPRKERFRPGIMISGYFLIGIIYFVMRGLIIGKTVVSGLRFDHEFWLRIVSIPNTLVMYMRILLWPTDLHYYRCTDILSPFLPGCILLTGVIALITIILKKMDSTHRKLFVFSLAWFVIMLLPVLNILPIINEYSLILTSDHFLYLPLVGFSLAILVFLLGLFKNRDIIEHKRVHYILIVISLSCVLGYLTFNQNDFYRSEVSLFKNTLKYEPDFGRAHILLAKAYYGEENFEKAIEENTKALAIMKNYLSVVKEERTRDFYLGFVKGIYFDLAHCFEQLGHLTQALENYFFAIKIDPRDEVLHNNIGVIFVRMGKINKAIDFFQKSYNLKNNPLARENLKQAKRLLEQSRNP